MVSLFNRLKTFNDYQREEEEFQLKKQKLDREAQGLGGTVPAALQLANEYKRRMDAGDVEGANLLAQFAKIVDKGLQFSPEAGYQSMPGYGEALGSINAQRAGMQRQAEKDVDLQMNPAITRAEIDQRNQSNLRYEPQIDSAREAAKNQALTESTDRRTYPIIDRLSNLNKESPDQPYIDKTQWIRRLVPGTSPEERSVELMKQARTELAAPLAKQLGVNPTDKDFQASLERIFDMGATKESRQAQIDILAEEIKRRQSQSKSLYQRSEEQFNAKKNPGKKRLKYNPATGELE